MAAHTLTIIHQTLSDSITDSTCERIEHACGFAPGMDVPAISTNDWELIHEAAKTRLPAMLKVALENVLPRVQYQEAYRTVEQHNAARARYVQFETDGWLQRSEEWTNLPQSKHREFATLVTQPVLAA